MSGDDLRHQIVRAGHEALDAALSRLSFNAGDTFTLRVPLPVPISADSTSAVVWEALREVGETRGYTLSYTTGATVAVLTKVNMPASGRGAVSAAAEPLALDREWRRVLRSIAFLSTVAVENADLSDDLKAAILLILAFIYVLTERDQGV